MRVQGAIVGKAQMVAMGSVTVRTGFDNGWKSI